MFMQRSSSNASTRSYKAPWDDGGSLGQELRTRLASIDTRLEALSRQLASPTPRAAPNSVTAEAIAMLPHQVSEDLEVIGGKNHEGGLRHAAWAQEERSSDSDSGPAYRSSFSRVEVFATHSVRHSQALDQRLSDSLKETTLAGRFCAWFQGLRDLSQDGAKKPRTWHWVHNNTFELMSCIVRVMNAGFIGLGGTVQLQTVAFGTPRPAWIDIGEMGFCIFFALELLARLIGERPLFFCLGEHKAWNALDSFIVLSTILDIVVNGVDSGAVAVTVGRLLRIVRFIRIFRLTRVIQNLSKLRVLVFTIINSLGDLFWCLAAIMFIMYMYTVLLLFGLIEHFEAAGSDVDILVLKARYGGGVYDIMLSLFMSICGGIDWQEAFDHWNGVHQGYGWIFLSYIFIMFFGVLNVVVANFVKTSMDYAAKDRDTFIHDQEGMLKDSVAKLEAFFHEADTDKNGSLTWGEFKEHIQKPKVQSYFQALGLDIVQAHKLYELLDANGDQDVSLDEFLSGCMRLRGGASSVDLNVILMHTARLTDQVDSIGKRSQEQLGILKEMRNLGCAGGVWTPPPPGSSSGRRPSGGAWAPPPPGSSSGRRLSLA